MYLILVLFFYPGEPEPSVPPPLLLHIFIPSFIIVLMVIATMIILRKQLCQKLYSRKGKWLLFMVTMWTGCLQGEALLCTTGLRRPNFTRNPRSAYELLWVCFDDIFSPQKKMALIFSDLKPLHWIFLKGLFCTCGRNCLLCSLSWEVPSAS